MPPKKGGKKKKKSKEELEQERLEKEAEDERLRLEEEARLAEEERIRAEEEARRLAELARLRAEELARIAAEVESDAEAAATRAKWLKELEDAEAKRLEWEKFVACSSKPDPSQESQLNTFITEARAADEPKLDDAMAAAKYADDIVHDLEVELATARERGDADKAAAYLEQRARLRSITTDKLDRATANVMVYAEDFIAEKGSTEITLQRKLGDVSYGLWVNLGGRAFRIKPINLDTLKINVDVPKPIASLSVGIRAIWHEYDNAVDRAQAVARQAEVATLDAPKGALTDAGKTVTGVLSAQLKPKPTAAEEVAAALEAAEAEAAAEAAAAAASAEESEKKGDDGTEGKGEEGKGDEGKDGEAEAEAEAALPEVPKVDVAAREAADAAEEAKLAALDAATSAGTGRDVPLGGVMFVEMLELPPPAKQVRAWTMREVTTLSKSVERLPHPMAEQSGAAGAAQALKVRFTMPPHVIMPGSGTGDDGDDGAAAAGEAKEGDGPAIRVAHWDTEAEGGKGAWSEEGITEAEYDASNRRVTFHTCRLTAMAVIQPRHTHLPFYSWSLVPAGDPTADFGRERTVLSLATPRFTVAIEIAAGSVVLQEPNIPELSEIRGTPLTPAQLLQGLARSGLIIDPIEEDALFVSSPFSGKNLAPKKRVFERRVYNDISTLAAAFSVRSSKWNQGVSNTCAVLSAKETLDPMEPDADETDWRCVLFEEDMEASDMIKCSIIKARESSDAYDGERAEMEETHRRIGIPIASRSTPEAMEIANGSSPLFMQTVAQMLALVRPLSFN